MKTKLTYFTMLLVATAIALPIHAGDYTTKRGLPKSINVPKPPVFVQAERQKSIDKTPTKGVPFHAADNAAKAKPGKAAPEVAPTQQRRGAFAQRFDLRNPLKRGFKAYEEVVDEHGIIIMPAAGTRKLYARAGKSYKNIIGEGLKVVDQSGYVHIVECDDGTVYIRNIVSSLGTGAWVKGTRDGNTITVPTRQPILYQYEETASVRWGVNDLGFSAYDDYADSFTFTINGNTIRLNGSSEDIFMGVSWDNDQSFAFAGDYDTEWTYSHDFEPLEVVEVALPAGATVEKWYTKGHERFDQNNEAFRGNVNVAFVGSDVYVQGVFAEFPQAWIKGTIDGDKVVFKGIQRLGAYEGTEIYAVGTDESDVVEYEMSYDADAKELKSRGILLANADTENVSYLHWLSDLTISATNPFAPITTLPYSNGFDSTEEVDWFTVENSNSDAHTWRNEDGAMRYHYDSELSADDWLFSPAFSLKAGKVYRLAIDTWSQSYIERIEVKMGKEAASSAMTNQVIEPTEVSWDEPATIENGLIAIDADADYYFGIHAISDADCNVLYVDNFYLEEVILEAPDAVTDFTVTPGEYVLEATVNFTAPSKNINGDALTAPLTAIEIVRDGNVIYTFNNVEPGAALSYKDTEGLTVGRHIYQIIPYNSYGAGRKSDEIKITLQQMVEVPFVADFTDESTFDLFTAIDANEDLFTWLWEVNSHAFYSYHAENSADDYLVTPPVQLTGGQNYDITIHAGAGGYPERFEVVVGTEATAAALSTVVIEPTEVSDEDNLEVVGTFTPESDGIYFVAVHAISDPDQYELRIHSLSITEGADNGAPAAPQLSVEAAPQGDNKAILSIVAPATAINGSSLTAPLEKIEVYRDNALAGEITDVNPGSSLTFTDADVENGVHTYYVMAYNDKGFGLKSERVSAYIGLDAPEAVENLDSKDNGNSVSLSWDKVSETGKNGGFVNRADVDYDLYNGTVSYDWGFPMIMLEEEPFTTLRDADSYEVEIDTEEGEQQYAGWGVIARNELGESESRGTALLVGKSYDLPVTEGFANRSLHYFWESDGQMFISTESSDGDDVSLALSALEAGAASFNSGKLNIKDAANPVLLFDAKGYGVSDVKIVATLPNGSTVDVATAEVTAADFARVKVPLNDLRDNSYVRLAFVAEIVNPTEVDDWTGEIITAGDALVIDNIHIVDLYADNLSVTVAAPAAVAAGKTAAITATVTNEGENPTSAFEVTIKAAGEVLLSQTVDKPLASFASTQIVAQWPTSVFLEPGDVEITAEVKYDADQKTDDNVATTSISIEEPVATSPSDLVATDLGDEGVALTWDAPVNAVAEIVEDVDDTDVFPAFSLGGITADNHTGHFGPWTLYDSTGSEVYTWSSDDVHYDNANAPAAWQVFDPRKAGITDGSFDAHSGDQCLLSMCPIIEDGEGPAADHWLISPELTGEEQTISFYLRAISSGYGDESFSVLASSTDTDPENFTLVEEFNSSAIEWGKFTATLPEGTKYFAIRHTSYDVFGLMLDDISYQTGVSAPEAYNIYYEGKLVGTVAGDELSYTVDGTLVEAGTRSFGVSAVYAGGIESRPVTATVEATSSVAGIIADSQPVDIYTTDGKLVRRAATSFEGLKGIFVVKGRTILIK